MEPHLRQGIKLEELPAEDFRFVKGQEAIYDLCKAVLQKDELKTELANARNPEAFLKVAADNGYEFTIEDLQFTFRWLKEKNEFYADEFDDYELDEEELETVAGGTVAGRSMSRYSYWHETGILVNQQCFHLLGQSAEGRSQLETALETMELWIWEGDGKVRVFDLDGKHDSYVLTNMAYNGLAPSLLADKSGQQTYKSDSPLLKYIL